MARKLRPPVVWPALAAPPLGLAIFGAVTLILYAWGLRLGVASKICVGLAVPGLVLLVRDGLRYRLNRSHGEFPVALLVAALLVLLPKWLGHPEFPIFQMNVADQFSYVTRAWMALHYDYQTIRQMDYETQMAIGFGLGMPFLITLRPAVALMLAVSRPWSISRYWPSRTHISVRSNCVSSSLHCSCSATSPHSRAPSRSCLPSA